MTIYSYYDIIDSVSYAVHHIPVTYLDYSITSRLYLLFPFIFFVHPPTHFDMATISLFSASVSLFLFAHLLCFLDAAKPILSHKGEA